MTVEKETFFGYETDRFNTYLTSTLLILYAIFIGINVQSFDGRHILSNKNSYYVNTLLTNTLIVMAVYILRTSFFIKTIQNYKREQFQEHKLVFE